jgi:hypothetical protein
MTAHDDGAAETLRAQLDEARQQAAEARGQVLAQLGCWDRIAANLAGLQDQIVQARLRLLRDHLQQNPPRACTEPQNSGAARTEPTVET